jgi:hypothetical protein
MTTCTIVTHDYYIKAMLLHKTGLSYQQVIKTRDGGIDAHEFGSARLCVVCCHGRKLQATSCKLQATSYKLQESNLKTCGL